MCCTAANIGAATTRYFGCFFPTKPSAACCMSSASGRSGQNAGVHWPERYTYMGRFCAACRRRCTHWGQHRTVSNEARVKVARHNVLRLLVLIAPHWCKLSAAATEKEFGERVKSLKEQIMTLRSKLIDTVEREHVTELEISLKSRNKE